eukprot:TRINITY_DN11735_c0_g1_i1.p1 TRINITY_DN11735_c0_g1~~TRINITY_DN11735_c0_g1_i1.p1  ORF type:complete len:129 (-),score=18.89 TRINITY_DN11735_c0_g1_i1:20-406(-)
MGESVHGDTVGGDVIALLAQFVELCRQGKLVLSEESDGGSTAKLPAVMGNCLEMIVAQLSKGDGYLSSSRINLVENLHQTCLVKTWDGVLLEALIDVTKQLDLSKESRNVPFFGVNKCIPILPRPLEK